MRQEAEEIRKSAKSPLPFDLDKNLAPQLQQLAKMTDEMAKELEKLQNESETAEQETGRQAGRDGQAARRGPQAVRRAAVEPMEYLRGGVSADGRPSSDS